MASNLVSLLLAFELGFRAAERGENPQAALAKFAAQAGDDEPAPASPTLAPKVTG